MLAHIHTQDGITVVLAGRPVHIAVEDKYYDEVVDAIQDGASESEVSDIIETVKREIANHCATSQKLDYNDGEVTYQGAQLRGYAVDKLIGLIHAGMDTSSLERFLSKLQQNPSTQTREDLYAFLEHGKMPINADGNFLAYKAVRQDFKDIHSGQFDNSIGAVCSMPRAQVDDRRENTCSRGFHVCSFDYLPHFSHADGHVMVCEINPADVVSIPADYNNTKMRVSQYTVIGEVENYYAEKRNILSEVEVWDESYTAYVQGFDSEDFDNLDEAIDYTDAFTGEVKILNSSGVMVYYKAA